MSCDITSAEHWGAGRSLLPSALCAEAASGAVPEPLVQGLGRPAPTRRRPGHTSARGSPAAPPGLGTAADRSPWCGSELARALPTAPVPAHTAQHTRTSLGHREPTAQQPERTRPSPPAGDPDWTACLNTLIGQRGLSDRSSSCREEAELKTQG